MIPIIPYSHYYWVGGPPKADVVLPLLRISEANLRTHMVEV